MSLKWDGVNEGRQMAFRLEDHIKLKISARTRILSLLSPSLIDWLAVP